MPTCPTCSRPVQPADGPLCPDCSGFIGYPNVRRTQTPREKQALADRYAAAYAEAAARGAGDRTQEFEVAARDSKAVVNMSFEVFKALVVDGALYSTYRLQVASGMRAPAAGDWDRQRAAVDAILFGTYDQEIRYAALALDGSGLSSYEAFSVTLKDAAIEKRASLLSENAYDFVPRHGVGPFSPPPPGHMAAWEDRAVLATTERAAQIDADTDPDAFAAILLHDAGEREDDRFIEVHIHGPFGGHAIEAARGPVADFSARERAKLAAVQDHLTRNGSTWTDA